MTIRNMRNIAPPPAKKWKRQEEALSASVKPVEKERAVEARTPETAVKEREKGGGGAMLVPHSGARQRWESERPLNQPMMKRGGLKPSVEKEPEGQKRKSESKHERSPSSSSTQSETSTSDSDTADSRRKKKSGGRREKSHSGHHKASRRLSKGDESGPLRSKPVVKRLVEEEKRSDRQSNVKTPEIQRTAQQLRELIDEMKAKSERRNKEEKEDKERMEKVARLAAIPDEVAKASTSRDDRKRSHHSTGEKYTHRGRNERSERGEEKHSRSRDREHRRRRDDRD